MKSNYDALGNYIRLVDTRNTDFVTEQVLGINIDKYFMPSVANVIGTDLSKYKLITKGKFACNPMHVGRDERLPVALYTEDEPAIVSPAYFMFEIIDNSILNEDYLMMWFRRPEFDRLCWLRTDGSVRGGITWDDICRMKVPVPRLDEQIEIVQSYQAITDRIALKKQINDNLEATAQAWFTSWFVDYEPFPHSYDEDGKPLPPDDWENGILDSCIDFYNGYAFKSDDLLDEPIPESFDVFKMGNIKKGGGLNYEGTKSWIEREFCKGLERFILIRGDILMAMTDMKENVALLGHTALMDIDDKYIVNQRVGLLRPNGFMGISPYQVYLLTNNATFLRELRRHAHIGVQVNLSKEDIVNSRVVYAPKKINQAFATKVKPLFDCISNNNAEILKLTEIASQIQSQLSR